MMFLYLNHMKLIRRLQILLLLILFFFRQKVSVYLRSDGFKEYKIILGSFGSFFYYIMYTIVKWKASFVTCGPHLLKEKEEGGPLH